MRALLDINVIIALFDPDHAFHERAHQWWSTQLKEGWASCPLTENGVVRIMTNPAYSSKAQFTPAELIERLRIFASGTNHEFWPDDLSLRDRNAFASDRIHGGKQLTDIYLLELASKQGARLATFDTGVPLSPARHAAKKNLRAI